MYHPIAPILASAVFLAAILPNYDAISESKEIVLSCVGVVQNSRERDTHSKKSKKISIETKNDGQFDDQFILKVDDITGEMYGMDGAHAWGCMGSPEVKNNSDSENFIMQCNNKMNFLTSYYLNRINGQLMAFNNSFNYKNNWRNSTIGTYSCEISSKRKF